MVLLSTMGCAQVEQPKETQKNKETKTTTTVKKEKIPHKYGGWYCPDNLNGFPAVDVSKWAEVPVISGRLPTKEETQTEASLMYIDSKEYPEAKAIDIKLPQLATFYNEYSKKDEYIIVIQAVEIGIDSVVGFRYLNGGNGSAYINEVNFLTEDEAAKVPTGQFVSYSIKIEKANQDRVWEVITKNKYLSALQPSFSDNLPIDMSWRSKTNANYYYASYNQLTSPYAGKLFGCYYIQNDYMINTTSYVEKFLLLENLDEDYTELKITCGPYSPLEYEKQKTVIENWAKIVREIIVDC